MTMTETYRRSSNVIFGKTATSPPSDLRHGLHALASMRREADAYGIEKDPPTKDGVGHPPVGRYADAALAPLRKASRSALIVSASVVGMPCGKFL